MVKVYLPSFAICTLSLTVNLLLLGIYPLRAIAQESVVLETNKQGNSANSADVEPEILAEINRVRTNPQGYAHWLEDQKQYYDQIWLKLPGEKPIRAHRLEKAIDEAIAVLKEQKPLPALGISEKTSATATQRLEDFASANNNIQNISYGRITPQGIVMSLVVDELFPDRRRRKNLLSPNVEDTGVVCQNDPRYAKVCAIAYSNPEADNTAGKQPETPSSSETETVASQPKTPPPVETEATADKPDIPETIPETEEKPEATTENTEVATENLPQPPQPQVPPTPPDPPEVSLPTPEADKSAEEIEEETEVSEAELEEELESDEDEDTEIVNEDIEEELEDEDVTDNEGEVESDIEDAADNEEVEEVFEAEEDPEDEEEQVATNSDSSRLLENVERGALEEGDRIIAEDGSFYDSYPLDAKSGESFTIALESDEFDAFVALIDAEGNIIEQNDDINEEDSNSRIRVTIPENGVYNVIVNAYDEGGTGQYVLTVSR